MIVGRRVLLGGLTAAFAGGAAAQPREPLTVLAAASLTDVLPEIGRAFTAGFGQPVRFSFASSAVLARQLEAGARADLFISADAEWMDHVQARRLVDASTRRDLLGNRLVLVAPRRSTVRLALSPDVPLVAALGPRGRLAVADPGSVPAGRYARSALQSLRVWNDVAARLALADNVRGALALVSRGEAPLGVVYQTDALAEPEVRVVAVFPPSSHPPIVYPVAVTRGARPGAQALHAFLRGPAASAVFRRGGFIVLSKATARAR